MNCIIVRIFRQKKILMLNGKKIILGITGGIAAYKSALLVRLLVKEGVEVKVIMTPSAKEFITPLTMATLSKNPIMVDFYNPENGDWNSHVDMGLWADAIIVAPATANTIGKMANAIADNLLVTTYLSAKCPIFIVPAMDLDMYRHPANRRNIDTLQSFGNIIIEPTSGELASGLEGKGRMEEPEQIVGQIKSFFKSKASLRGKQFLVTAGPTYEKLDPVRFIGNYSSGKMGFAIAEELAIRGADVVLVSGPTHLDKYAENIELVRVNTADEMYKACMSFFPTCNGAVMSAAVADFTPIVKSEKKVKSKSSLSIDLKATLDIAAELGKIKQKDQILVGFALETNNEKSNAVKKLKEKNLDFIVLNSLNDKGAGFNSDTNKVTFIDKLGKEEQFELKPKRVVAIDIVQEILKFMDIK